MSFKLFAYPQQASFGKVLPKSKIYEFAKPCNAVRDKFIKQIEQIVWAYKLSSDTINIPPGDGVQEIQILKIHSKVAEIGEDVFRTIDEVIPSHVFYEINFGNRSKLIAAYKRQSEADSTRWVTGSYFGSEWVSSTLERRSLPIALNMGALYAEMLRTLMPGAPRDGEPLRFQAERLEKLRINSLELNKLRLKLAKEKQFNRKVEINSQIKKVQSLINQLIV